MQGKITVEKLTEAQVKRLKVFSWPIWEKEVSRFEWYYDSIEQCYFLAGSVTIETDEGPVEITKGDFVTFPVGLRCVWVVKEPVRKHYKFH